MAEPTARRLSAPSRTFGQPETDHPPSFPAPRRLLGSISLGNLKNAIRPSFSFSRGINAKSPSGLGTDKPPIPTMLPASTEIYSTPLPKLSMIVLSITMLGEFLCANVSTPFLLFMVKGFGEFTDDAQVAFWTGILVATFFLTQFMTSLLWATVAEKHGRRVVLAISLLGSALTCSYFGTSTSLQQALCIRLLQGVFAGAVGVARGSVAFITDPSNEGRAYAILGFCWGFGGVAGAIVGGAFERPATKWPHIFGGIELFERYPYLLPCCIAALITLLGSFLSLFLGRDGGPREGAIRLPPEKLNIPPPIPEEEDDTASQVFEDEDETGGGLAHRLQTKFSRKFSGLFSRPVLDIHIVPPESTTLVQPPLPLASTSGVRLDRTRTFSTSRPTGSAYGYGSGYRHRLASSATWNGRRGSLSATIRRRRGSNLDSIRDGPTDGSSDLNFAQRLLLANENAVTNIADLWVAAAMNVDNEDPFESDESDTEQNPDARNNNNDDEFALDADESGLNAEEALAPRRGSVSSSHATRTAPQPHRPSMTGSTAMSFRRPSSHRPSMSSHVHFREGGHRRLSTNVPAIFAHPGVKPPPGHLLDAQRLLLSSVESLPIDRPLTTTTTTTTGGGGAPELTPISESPRVGSIDAESLLLTEKPPSLMSQLPIVVIIQYGVMALHTTTHDQIFLSYLVSDYDSGGLNLNASHFAQLIALMCLVQILYQFYLYPNIGPPRGRFSHLAMFRIGTIMFIPSYLTVILYRPLHNTQPDEANPLLMIGLSISTAVRFCGTTFGYTAMSILLNYMTPPEAVGYANGIAQSIVSLARCVGPVIGGYIWAFSVQGSPSGYYLGFLICAGVCAISVLQSFLIR